ncbi:hypothetical protein J437_LFUL004802 [Ladona fulva]|uniref:DNA/RNA-binding protein Alba-like domain-containing protein n=1 Tax=Ladona fulva TaxID=123851 RepID=A0A8K0K070_LADFU|nr:hypothetical protein J437_LFUL004802 [Ladona fulva]
MQSNQITATFAQVSKLYVFKMEKYTKGKCIEEPLERSRVPIDCLPETFLWMKVKPNSKLRNLLGLATNFLKDEQVVLWTGSGPAVIKAISCAEIMKRKFNNLHQITKLCFRKVTETWDPISDGLDELVVEREVPTIHILLSKDALDSNELGYQPPGDSKAFQGSGQNPKGKNSIHSGRARNYQPRQKKVTATGKEVKFNSKFDDPKRFTEQRDEKILKRKRESECEANNGSLKQ